jgi:glycosyltransferase 2 family protein
MKKLNTILLALGVVFLAYLLWKIGARELWQKLLALGWGLVPLILGEGVAEMLHTAGWRHCLSGPCRSLSFARLFRIRITGYAINYLTPTATLGGEVVKASLLSMNNNGPEAASSVLIDKVCFAVSHLLFVVAGGIILLGHLQLPGAVWWVMVISSALVAFGVLAFLLLQKYGKLGVVIRWLAARRIGGPALQKASGYITEVDEAMRVFYRNHPRDLILATCWHLLGHSVGIVQTWLFFALLDQNVSLLTVANAWFLGLWFDLPTFFVPLNLGTLEGSRILAFKAIGFDALLGMSYGVTLRFGQIFWSAFGLINYGLLALRPGNLPLNVPSVPHRTTSPYPD